MFSSPGQFITEQQLPSTAVAIIYASLLCSMPKEENLMFNLSFHCSHCGDIKVEIPTENIPYLQINFKDLTLKVWKTQKVFLLKVVVQNADYILAELSVSRFPFVESFQLIKKKCQVAGREQESQSFPKLCNHHAHCKIKIYCAFQIPGRIYIWRSEDKFRGQSSTSTLLE